MLTDSMTVDQTIRIDTRSIHVAQCSVDLARGRLAEAVSRLEAILDHVCPDRAGSREWIGPGPGRAHAVDRRPGDHRRNRAAVAASISSARRKNG